MLWLLLVSFVAILFFVALYRRPAHGVVATPIDAEASASSSWPRDLAVPGQPVAPPADFPAWMREAAGPDHDQPHA
jgi:hypothetical protein